MFLDHKQRRSTVGRTSLDEWSARRRDLNLTTHDTHNRQISMPPVGFEPKISAGERPAAAHLLKSWVRIPTGAWIFVCCECRVLSGWGLCDELITRPEESYRLWFVVVCDLETSRIGAPYIYDISNLRVKVFLIVCVLQMLCQLMLLVTFGYVILTVMEGPCERSLSPREVGISRMKSQDSVAIVCAVCKLDTTFTIWSNKRCVVRGFQ